MLRFLPLHRPERLLKEKPSVPKPGWLNLGPVCTPEIKLWTRALEGKQPPSQPLRCPGSPARPGWPGKNHFCTKSWPVTPFQAASSPSRSDIEPQMPSAHTEPCPHVPTAAGSGWEGALRPCLGFPIMRRSRHLIEKSPETARFPPNSACGDAARPRKMHPDASWTAGGSAEPGFGFIFLPKRVKNKKKIKKDMQRRRAAVSRFQT